MQDAVDKNYQKVLAEKKEKQDKEKEDQLKGKTFINLFF